MIDKIVCANLSLSHSLGPKVARSLSYVFDAVRCLLHLEIWIVCQGIVSAGNCLRYAVGYLKQPWAHLKRTSKKLEYSSSVIKEDMRFAKDCYYLFDAF